MSLCGIAQASDSVEPLNKALGDVVSVQMDLAIAQEHFSVMSREMADKERGVAREPGRTKSANAFCRYLEMAKRALGDRTTRSVEFIRGG